MTEEIIRELMNHAGVVALSVYIAIRIIDWIMPREK